MTDTPDPGTRLCPSCHRHIPVNKVGRYRAHATQTGAICGGSGWPAADWQGTGGYDLGTRLTDPRTRDSGGWFTEYRDDYYEDVQDDGRPRHSLRPEDFTGKALGRAGRGILPYQEGRAMTQMELVGAINDLQERIQANIHQVTALCEDVRLRGDEALAIAGTSSGEKANLVSSMVQGAAQSLEEGGAGLGNAIAMCGEWAALLSTT